ncbi:ficolin-2-like [Drosophila willistoni]|uniref:ficolin-2-like n=1 Tax=Drosophila willistoni TaxID=7260 RepID=UPI001F0871CC|nr:ficolin-2-like [Drosophila willistoni]
MNPQSVVSFWVLCLLFVSQQVTSSSPLLINDLGNCGLQLTHHMTRIDDLITYIMTKQRDEIDEVKFIALNNENDLKNQIEELQKIVINYVDPTGQKTRIQSKIEENLERQIENLKETYSREIKELNSEFSSIKKQLKEFQAQLSDQNHLLERYSLQLNQTEKRLPKGCNGLSSRIHTIKLDGIDPFPALCNRDIEGGDWIVIHKRFDGSENFKRTWTEYRNGFGNQTGEFFIGLEKLHRITNSETHELYVQMEYFNGSFKFANYDYFKIGNESTKYVLESVGKFIGTANNRMNYNLNQKYSTFDQNNDEDAIYNCAEDNGAWWHRHCSYVQLNGIYSKEDTDDWSSMSWEQGAITLKSAQMLIRPISNV